MDDKLFTEEEVKNAIDIAVTNALNDYKQSEEFKRIKQKAFDNQEYHLNEIVNNNDVKRFRNILARDYQLRQLIDLVNVYGFDVVNDYVLNLIDETEKEE